MGQDSITQLLHLLIQTAKANLEKRFEAAGIAITPLQFGVLKSLADSDSTLNDLSKKYGVRPPSLVPAVDALEQQGLVIRKPDPKDRRKSQITITQKGKELIGKLPEGEQNSSMSMAFEKLPVQKREQLTQLLKELISNLKEQE